MNNVFIFPGQASQFIGMAADLYEKYDLARTYFDRANDILGFDLKDVCFNGPEDVLKKTIYTQPAIFVHSIIISELLKKLDIKPAAVAGHSLGEYSALVSAGVMTFENGLKLVGERSRLMYKAGQTNPGTMGAIIGLDADKVYEICKSVADVGIVQPANFNSPGQIAISGTHAAVGAALQKAQEAGSRKAVELVVSGAFHSPLMQTAEDGLAEALKTTPMNDTEIPFYCNVTAKPVRKGADIKEMLLHQLTHPVLWQNIIVNMAADGFQNYLEVGPGKVLKGLLKRIDRSLTCNLCGNVEQLQTMSETV